MEAHYVHSDLLHFTPTAETVCILIPSNDVRHMTTQQCLI